MVVIIVSWCWLCLLNVDGDFGGSVCMCLKSIKLVGFKFFVDLIMVNFFSNMVVVVGLNGCGKLNIIDVVCWVMGESLVKNLCGELMIDVIFNGLNICKLVSQVSIELIFDNVEIILVGEYVQYVEIFICWWVLWDGQNIYFFNGIKCWWCDIIDIFFGIGLGLCSYLIIEQGMIFKLIEVCLEDLCNFIEEVVGIFKYKECCCEIESCICWIQENLVCFIDLCEELGW